MGKTVRHQKRYWDDDGFNYNPKFDRKQRKKRIINTNVEDDFCNLLDDEMVDESYETLYNINSNYKRK
jgi:hypothetical protein